MAADDRKLNCQAQPKDQHCVFSGGAINYLYTTTAGSIYLFVNSIAITHILGKSDKQVHQLPSYQVTNSNLVLYIDLQKETKYTTFMNTQ